MIRIDQETLQPTLRSRGWDLCTIYSVSSLTPGRESVSVVPAWRPYTWASFLASLLRLPWDGSGQFRGGLLWFFNYDLGLGNLDTTGQLAVARILCNHESGSNLLATSAWDLDERDFSAAHASLVIASAYGWDAVFVGNAGFAIEISHDEVLTVWIEESQAPKLRDKIRKCEKNAG